MYFESPVKIAMRILTRLIHSSPRVLQVNRPRRVSRLLPFIPTHLIPPTVEEAVDNILYNHPDNSGSINSISSSSSNKSGENERHVLNCMVVNEPGVLSRVAGILAGRGFNIDSLVVAKTEVPDLSRMTIVLHGKDSLIVQAKRQLEDIVPVWAVLDYTQARIIEREILLVKVSTIPHNLIADDQLETDANYSANAILSSSMQRHAIVDLAGLFGAKVVDVTLDSVTMELSAKPTRIDAFVDLLKPYGILEAARSGAMAMPRSIMDAQEESEDAPSPQSGAVDATMLPPG